MTVVIISFLIFSSLSLTTVIHINVSPLMYHRCYSCINFQKK